MPLDMVWISMFRMKCDQAAMVHLVKPLSANPAKWPNTQTIRKLLPTNRLIVFDQPTNRLSVFDHFWDWRLKS